MFGREIIGIPVGIKDLEKKSNVKDVCEFHARKCVTREGAK